MSRIKIDNLSVLEDLSDRETASTFGGTGDSEWRYVPVRRTTSATAEDDEPGLAGVTIFSDVDLDGI